MTKPSAAILMLADPGDPAVIHPDSWPSLRGPNDLAEELRRSVLDVELRLGALDPTQLALAGLVVVLHELVREQLAAFDAGLRERVVAVVDTTEPEAVRQETEVLGLIPGNMWRLWQSGMMADRGLHGRADVAAEAHLESRPPTGSLNRPGGGLDLDALLGRYLAAAQRLGLGR